jgi:hypothetical protein
MNTSLTGLFAPSPVTPKPVRIEPRFNEALLETAEEEQFEDLLASPFVNPLLEQSRGHFEL